MRGSLDQIIAKFDPSLPLDEAWTIPGEWYTDARVEALERRTVWSKTWQLVGRTSQVAEIGEYLTAEIAGEPIVVVRGTDNTLRAFFNVCRHHAAAVMTQPCGKVDRMRCPYHGWTYDLAGKLRGVPELEGVKHFDKDAMGLVPIAVATWEQFVFVHLDPDPPSIESYLGELVGQVAPLGLGALQFCERREYVLGCNWKVFVDNYLDGGYHVPHLHEGLGSILDYKHYTIESFDRFCLQSAPIDAGQKADAMAASTRKGDRALYYWIYPNLMLNWYEGYLDTNLVLPLGIDRVKVIFDFYFADVSDARMPENRKSIAVSQRIQDEDHAICESVQKGLSSRAYGAGRLSVRREAGENLFHKLLAADLRAGLTI